MTGIELEKDAFIAFVTFKASTTKHKSTISVYFINNLKGGVNIMLL